MGKAKGNRPAELPPVVARPVDSIQPYWRNPRKNEAGVDAVAKSIMEFGWATPIAIDKDGVILAGHTRYKAARKLGLSHVPTVTLDLSEEAAKAYRVADNAVADLSDWDRDLLVPELRALDTDMSDFFGDALDLGSLLSDGPEADVVTPESAAAAAADVGMPMAEGDVVKFVAVTCPHCGEDFRVAEKDVAARMGKAED